MTVKIPKEIETPLAVILIIILISFGGYLIYQFSNEDNYFKGAGGIILLYIASICLFNPKALKLPNLKIIGGS